ncbi:MAG: glycosyltransferase [Lachnospiraceae bacterium]|nr:glycosyltransferase [Lachnospiraceae bacterium]
MKTLSVIIPNYNNEKYLRSCLDSVLGQTYPLEEIVIYDDCSTDGSREILKEYAKKDQRLRLILAKENKGVSVARDIAIRSCHSEYISQVDADDTYYDENKLMREMQIINAHEEPVCAFSQTVLTDEDGNVTGDLTIQDLQKDYRFKTITQSIGVYIARDFCFPLKAYKEVGGYVTDMKLFEDWDLSLKLLSLCPFYFSGGYGTAYRQKASGLSRVSQRKIMKGKIRAFRQAGKYLHYSFREWFCFYARTYFYALWDWAKSLRSA